MNTSAWILGDQLNVDLARREYPHHLGKLDEFWMPVTRQEAELWFGDFLESRLDLFGPYEDAIVVGQRAAQDIKAIRARAAEIGEKLQPGGTLLR